MSDQVKLTPGQQAILDDATTTSTPEPSDTPTTLTDLSQVSDKDLQNLIDLLLQEQHERAVNNADPQALIEDGFERLFTGKGDATEPELYNGLLICPGSLRPFSGTSHECSFAHVDDNWCWEHPDLLEDDVRKTPASNGHDHQRSITIIPATEGTKIDFVTCKATATGGHKAKRSTSYVVKGGQLEITTTRSTPKPGPGR